MKIIVKEILKKKLPEKKDETSKRQQIALKALVGFLVIMIALTALSRFADSIIIPKVTVTNAKSGRVKHTSEFAGTIVTKEDVEIEAKEGLTIEEIFVEEGQQVNQGEQLIKLDVEELESQIKSIEVDLAKMKIQKQQLALKDPTSGNSDLVAEAKAEVERLKEDKALEIQQIDEKMKRIENEIVEAQEAVTDEEANFENLTASNLAKQIAEAEEEIEAAKKNVEKQKYEQEKALKRAKQDIEEIRKQLWVTEGDVTLILEQLKRAEMEYDITKEDWKRNVKEAEEELAKAEEKLKKLENGEVDQSILDAEQSKISVAKETVKSKEKELEDARYNKEQSIVQYDRNIADAEQKVIEAQEESAKNSEQQSKEELNNSLDQQSLEVDIRAKEDELTKLKEIKESNSILVAPVSGTVNIINVKKGEKTSSDILMTLLSDTTHYIFEAEVKNEDIKTVKVGDQVEIILDGEGDALEEETVINRIINLRGEKLGSSKIMVNLKEGIAGTNGRMVIEKESERYDYVVPESALYEDSQGKYVLVAKSQVTTLGEQMVVERVGVTVLDKNGEVVGIQGTFSGKDQIITKTNKHIKAGDRVRLLEQ